MATLGIPSNTIEVLQKYHFNFQKKFGQNFLIDTHVLEKIMNAAQISKDDCVVEVGPGIDGPIAAKISSGQLPYASRIASTVFFPISPTVPRHPE